MQNAKGSPTCSLKNNITSLSQSFAPDFEGTALEDGLADGLEDKESGTRKGSSRECDETLSEAGKQKNTPIYLDQESNKNNETRDFFQTQGR